MQTDKIAIQIANSKPILAQKDVQRAQLCYLFINFLYFFVFSGNSALNNLRVSTVRAMHLEQKSLRSDWFIQK